MSVCVCVCVCGLFKSGALAYVYSDQDKALIQFSIVISRFSQLYLGFWENQPMQVTWRGS